MSSLSTAANLSAYAFSVLCLASVPPFLGIPFPRRASAEYYDAKNEWLASISLVPMTRKQAGYCGAALRTVLGVGLAVGGTPRLAALAAMASIVSVGTVLAWRDGRPMVPQWTMLGATAVVWWLNR